MNPVIFVYPYSKSISGVVSYSSFNFCLGSAYCVAYLNQYGIPADAFISQEPLNVKACIKEILLKSPRIVGFTVYDNNYCLCQLIASELKKIESEILIVFGGPTPSVQAKTILERNDFVDICVRHEGEDTILQLFETLESINFAWKEKSNETIFENIHGISYRQGSEIYENSDRNVFLKNRSIANFLDKYPSPYLSGLLKNSELGIITTRGCNQNCTYCNCAVLYQRNIFTHSPDRVIAELDYISRRLIIPKGQLVEIFDDAFTLIPGRAKEICRKMIENRIRIPLSCSTRCDKVDEELLELMKEAGFKAISFSLESATPKLLRIIGKVQSPHTKWDPTFQKEIDFIDRFKQYSVYAKEIGFIVSASVMIGLPTETPEEGQNTIDFICSMSNVLDSYAHNIFQVLPGTPVFYNYEQYGLGLKKLDNGIHYKTIHSYNFGQIIPAPHSHLEIHAVQQERKSIKSLSFFPRETKTQGYFQKIVLMCNHISKELIYWFRENLALNGVLIQVYSSLEKAKEHHEENWHNFYRYISPTLFHITYFQSSDGENSVSFIPYRNDQYGTPWGMKIKLLSLHACLFDRKLEYNPKRTICIDYDRLDVLALQDLLTQIKKEENAVECLFNNSFIPYIAALCRWERNIPNCYSLDTIIIVNNFDLKVCWNSNAIGTIEMSFDEIQQKMNTLIEYEKKQRECGICVARDKCVQCVFPCPLSVKEYCEIIKFGDLEKPVSLLRAFDYIKDV